MKITTRPLLSLSTFATSLAGALLYARYLTGQFTPDILTVDHPVIAFCTSLIVAGIAWCGLVVVLRTSKVSGKHLTAILLLLGLSLRLMFFESSPVYENDYKRYLWDGAVTAAGENPYRFSPAEVFAAGEPGAQSVPDLTRLAIKSNDANYFTSEINSSKLTTIYPPGAQVVFAVAHVIAPYKAWGLKLVFLMIEALGLIALIAGLRTQGLDPLWSATYWLNPIVIFTTYNGVHMDVLLVAPLLGALFFVGRHPFRAALLLGIASSIKIWPLLLAPVLFRGWRHRPIFYIGIAALVGSLTLLSIAPMLVSASNNSGLAAYSANWTNSSFLFPGIRDGLGLLIENSDRVARYVVAALLTGFSLWLGFATPRDTKTLPIHLMWLAATFIFLSPTGYPWYFIWFLMFLPFTLHHWSSRGLTLLTIGAAVYFARFKIGEAGHYDIYVKLLLPFEFGIPLLVLGWDRFKVKRHA